MTTIYTVNNKVLKNVATDKWLIKPPPPDPMAPVQIGTQIWSSKNLAIDDGQGGIYTQTVNYGQGDVTEYYYTWDAAVRVAATVQGWHLPSVAEWNTLVDAVGYATIAGTKLKSTYGWDSGNGDGSYAFAAFPSGLRTWGNFNGLGTKTGFWTSIENSSDQAYQSYFYTGNSVQTNNSYSKVNSCSVRLIQDT